MNPTASLFLLYLPSPFQIRLPVSSRPPSLLSPLSLYPLKATALYSSFILLSILPRHILTTLPLLSLVFLLLLLFFFSACLCLRPCHCLCMSFAPVPSPSFTNLFHQQNVQIIMFLTHTKYLKAFTPHCSPVTYQNLPRHTIGQFQNDNLHCPKIVENFRTKKMHKIIIIQS